MFKIPLISNNPMIALIIACIFLVACIIMLALTFISYKRHSMSEAIYQESMSSTDGSVIQRIINAKGQMKEKSDEEKILGKAVFYLQHSITRDYYSAFSEIETIFRKKTTKEIHTKIIDEETLKNTIWLNRLPQKK